MPGMHHTLSTQIPLPSGQNEYDAMLAEAAWIEVVQRMDEVYSELVTSQETLEAKHRELAESHRFVRGVLSAMSDVLLVCDTLGVVRQVNMALLVLTGLSETALIGQHLADLAADLQERETVRALINAGHGDIHELELPLMRADGEAVPVTWNVNPLSDSAGRYSGFVAVGRPVGELKRAYSELKATHEALKAAQSQLIQAEKMASLGRLVAGVAHELNNPISFVLGNAHAMARYGQKLARYLDAVHAQALQPEARQLRDSLKIDRLIADLPSLIAGLMEGAERSSAIVDGLKRFSAIDDDISQPVELGALVARALHWVSRASPHQVQVRSTQPEAGIIVPGSANQLQQVLVNLLQNAFDAVESSDAPQIELVLQTRAGSAVLTVADNGPGISEAGLHSLFDPFYTTKAVGKGTGLGLSISYGIVERHCGRLEASNQPQGGALFTLTLPMSG